MRMCYLRRSCSCITFFVALTIFALSVVGLGVSIKFYYFGFPNNLETGTCRVLSCMTDLYQCDSYCYSDCWRCESYCSVYTCDHLSLTLELINVTSLSGAPYIRNYTNDYSRDSRDNNKPTDPGLCYKETVLHNETMCYYSPGNINGTLGLDSPSPSAGSQAVVGILVVIVAIALIVALVAGCCMDWLGSSYPSPDYAV